MPALLDIFLAVVWVACVVYGFRAGLVRQIYLVVGVAFALILAAQGYRPVGDIIAATGGPAGFTVIQPLAYVLIYIMVLALVVAISYYATPVTRLGHEKRLLDRAGGVLLAGLWGVFFLAGVVISLEFLSLAVWPGMEDSRQFLELLLLESRGRVFLFGRLPLVQTITDPVIPEILKGLYQ